MQHTMMAIIMMARTMADTMMAEKKIKAMIILTWLKISVTYSHVVMLVCVCV